MPIHKKGKLLAQTIGHDYELEYGTDRIEIHTDAISKGEKVLLVDDLIATGGTAEAAVILIEKMGGKIVDAQDMTENLRYGADYHTVPIKTHLKMKMMPGAEAGVAHCADARPSRYRFPFSPKHRLVPFVRVQVPINGQKVANPRHSMFNFHIQRT